MSAKKSICGVCATALLLFGLGCGSVLQNAGFGRSATIEIDPADQRLAYQTDGDPQALRWLLRNEVRQGMTIADVNQTLGEDGTIQYLSLIHI